jgi:hypothetical protein
MVDECRNKADGLRGDVQFISDLGGTMSAAVLGSQDVIGRSSIEYINPSKKNFFLSFSRKTKTDPMSQAQTPIHLFSSARDATCT